MDEGRRQQLEQDEDTARRAMLPILLLISLSTYIFFKLRRPRLPGPPSFPLLGNIFQIPKSHEWIQYAKWSKKYGPIIHLTLPTTSVIIINTHEAAVDLLEKRSSIYSDRPRLPMAGDLIGWSRAVTLHPSSPRHKTYRKLLHTVLSKSSTPKFHAIQFASSQRLLLNLHANPKGFRKHIRQMVGGTVVRIAYGIGSDELNEKGDSEEERYIEMAEIAQLTFSQAATPNAYWVDILPFLKHIPSWFPFATFKRRALQWREELEELTYTPFERVKNEMKLGTAPYSYVSSLLANLDSGSDSDFDLSSAGNENKCDTSQMEGRQGKEKAQEREHDVMWSALSLYTGGADTTVAALSTFFLAMTLYPGIQAEIQAELDKVISLRTSPQSSPQSSASPFLLTTLSPQIRLPTFADRPFLPLLNATIQETLRWKPVLPLGVAHRVVREDEWNGLKVPSGSTIIPNLWAMLQDPSQYPSPERFNPYRFLGTSMTTATDRSGMMYAFGFGRRICPGIWTAEATLFITIAHVLSVFTISKALDANGNEIGYDDVEYCTGMISHPGGFECRIQPRSPNALELLNRMKTGEDVSIRSGCAT